MNSEVPLFSLSGKVSMVTGGRADWASVCPQG